LSVELPLVAIGFDSPMGRVISSITTTSLREKRSQFILQSGSIVEIAGFYQQEVFG